MQSSFAVNKVLNHAFRMNEVAKSRAFLCTLNFFTIASMHACSLSTPSRYARRYARAFRENFRDVESGKASGDIEARMRPWKFFPLFFLRKCCFILPQSYSIPFPACMQHSRRHCCQLCACTLTEELSMGLKLTCELAMAFRRHNQDVPSGLHQRLQSTCLVMEVRTTSESMSISTLWIIVVNLLDHAWLPHATFKQYLFLSLWLTNVGIRG